MTLLTPQTKVRLTYFFYAIAVVGAVVMLIIGILTLNRVDTAIARIKDQNNQIKAQSEDVIRANNEQTILLCTFILRSDLGVTDETITQLEEICESEIERFQNRNSNHEAQVSTNVFNLIKP